MWRTSSTSGPKWNEERDTARCRAADSLLESLGSYGWDDTTEPNDPERYQPFKPIAPLVWGLITALDSAEYHEYCRDCEGAASWDVRAVQRQAHALVYCL